MLVSPLHTSTMLLPGGISPNACARIPRSLTNHLHHSEMWPRADGAPKSTNLSYIVRKQGIWSGH
ncbi:hypothetical protein BDQ94DRAFT_152590 [Aspergillus welwitschiae]|uniref:Uncharacterized protein n=1 Tax=Aspergillus welwitschiae TaxID=1341132 RepID=A0A3F3PMY6_9EURO|nr:hypothetical protein BDQ94DRAFT_152590 [Aspergillus welwitschiae]RDH28122.1 hypothetical protein BDQ94DRAFT_152590 [Aspergillus welwitschiae]